MLSRLKSKCRSCFDLLAEVTEVAPTDCVVEISKSTGELGAYQEVLYCCIIIGPFLLGLRIFRTLNLQIQICKTVLQKTVKLADRRSMQTSSEANVKRMTASLAQT